MWQWLYRWGSPKWFYLQSARLLPALSIGTCLLLFTGILWGLLFAPADYQQGDSFRIIYIHVPAAVLAQSAYVFMALAGAIFLIWRVKLADVAATSAATIGIVFCGLALATGAIWGKPTWGAWWVWDARVTATLVQFFLYLGVIALRQGLPASAAGSACAVLGLVGLINIPIIKYSVDWWFTLHQPATFTLTKAPAMASDMYWPLLLTGLGCYFLFALALVLFMRAEVIGREWASSWVAELTRGKHDE